MKFNEAIAYLTVNAETLIEALEVVRDVLSEVGTVEEIEPSGGPGHPFLADAIWRQQIVQQWYAARAKGISKATFAALVHVPGQAKPGVHPKTLTRWQKEFAGRPWVRAR